MLLFYLSLVGISNLFLGFLALFRNKKDASNIAFFTLTVLIVSWLSMNYVADYATTIDLNLLFTKLTMVLAFLAALGFYLFSILFMRRIKKIGPHTIILFILTLTIVLISIFSDKIIKSTSISNNVTDVVFGDFAIIYFVLFIYFLIVSLGCLFLKLRSSSGVDKKRIIFVAVGLALMSVMATFTNLIMPLVFSIFLLTPFGGFSTLFFTGFTTYAIVKHRLMDIRMVVAKSVAFMILIAFIGIFYTFTMIWLEKIIFPETGGKLSPGQIVFRIILTLFVVFTFQPLRSFITKKTDKIFFKQSYEPENLLDTLSHTMGSSIVLIELLYKILNILTSNMKVSRGFFVILKDGDKIDTTQGVGYKKSPVISLREIEILSKDGICIYDELDDKSQVKRILRKHDASLAIPLKSNNKVSGILFLGEKNSGDMYSAQDIRIFEILGPEVTVAIENAKSYEEIQQFNAVLRTEVQKATRELKGANQNLRELDKAKDEFISMASHQLRTPLTAIKGYLSMLLEGDAGEIKVGQYEFVQEAYYGATRMVSLINDLLNVSRMETGRFFLEIKEFDLTKTVEEEIKQLEKVARDKGIKLVYQKHGHVSLCADEMKVRQVVMNFVDNAIYYTLDGKVVVNLYDEGKNVRFEVTDNGIGVPKEQQKNLFTKFFRAENARSTRPDGTGLGLFMAKKVIEEHHGEVIFHSVEGKGSTFGFRLPKVAKVTKDNTSAFDPNIPLETPVNKAIEVMDKKIKDSAQSDKKEKKILV
ncbi:MAG: ATP-binding protein [bacterium]|nr:ATP-binding protein [bacterium]